jgi:two-component system sensor histidine kinase AlgZ
MFAFGDATWQTPWWEVVRQASVGFVYATCCIALGNLAMPRLAPVVRRRLWFPFDWAIVSLALVVLAMIACAGAVVILTAVGHYRVDQMKTAWTASVKSASYFTLLFGIMATIIGELQGRLDRATLDIRTKERDEAEARRLAVEAQLASLESRVDPHFFFNTLNSIAALVRDDPGAAERVVEKLAAVMRSSLDRGASPLVPLEQELGFVQNYLDIERVRFGDRLRYTIDVSTPLRSTLVPRLSLQTLVENSVKYAVSSRREGASVSVQATAVDGHMRLNVTDDGPGFDPSLVLPGHGLALLRARLALQFGGRATLSIASVPSRTVVSLDLPFEPRATSPESRVSH